MEEMYKNMKKAITHLKILHEIFINEDKMYKKIHEKLTNILKKIGFFNQLYGKKIGK